MRFLLLSALLIISTTGLAKAADVCTTIPNVAPGLGDVHDQAGLDWCHSFTVADLLTQKLQKLGVLKAGERIHPLQIAALYQLKFGFSPNRTIHKFASAEGVLDAVGWQTAHGAKLCTISDLDSLTTLKNPLFEKAASASLKLFSDAIHAPVPRRSETVGSKSCPADDQLMKLNGELSEVERKVWLDEMRRHCHVTMPAMSWHYWWRAEWSDEIRGKGKAPDPNKIRDLGKAIDTALENGQLVGINYNPDFMVSEKFKGGGPHWSSVIARQKSASGECLYQIRNSWGKSCGQYLDPSTCSSGLIWVPRSELLKNMAATQVIN